MAYNHWIKHTVTVRTATVDAYHRQMRCTGSCNGAIHIAIIVCLPEAHPAYNHYKYMWYDGNDTSNHAPIVGLDSLEEVFAFCDHHMNENGWLPNLFWESSVGMF